MRRQRAVELVELLAACRRDGEGDTEVLAGAARPQLNGCGVESRVEAAVYVAIDKAMATKQTKAP